MTDELLERASLAVMRAYGLQENEIGNILSECRQAILDVPARIAAAEAAALERAAEWLKSDEGVPTDGYFMSMRNRTPTERADAIRALITPDAQSALDQVIAEAVKKERERWKHERHELRASLIGLIPYAIVDVGEDHGVVVRARAAIRERGE